MTKVEIFPGICGFKATVTAELTEDEDEVEVSVSCGCKSIMGMMAALGSTYDPYEVCLVKPGKGPFFEYASENFPVHSGCPIISGITKCIEAEAGLALKKEAYIKFIE